MFVALWGVGTWNLYRLERRRQAGAEAAAKEYLRKETARVLQGLDGLIEHLQKPEGPLRFGIKGTWDSVDAILASDDIVGVVGPQAVEASKRIAVAAAPLRPHGDIFTQGDASLVPQIRQLREATAALHRMVTS